jgi:hypothetical protein
VELYSLMEFSKEIKQLLREAGWHPGRNVKGSYILPVSGYPPFVVNFLNEYASLKIDCMKHEFFSSVDELLISPEEGKYEYEADGFYTYYNELLKTRLFPLGLFSPTYNVCCDETGRIFLIGEYCCYRGKNLHEGIENIMRSDWGDSLDLDEETVKWRNRAGEYVSLP